jgi:hypothetical protein
VRRSRGNTAVIDAPVDALQVRAAIERLSAPEAEALQYDWNEWARDSQRRPGATGSPG